MKLPKNIEILNSMWGMCVGTGKDGHASIYSWTRESCQLIVCYKHVVVFSRFNQDPHILIFIQNFSHFKEIKMSTYNTYSTKLFKILTLNFII